MLRNLFVPTLLFILTSAYGIEESNSDYQFNYIGIEDGLVHPRVNSFLFDTEGFLWLGTHAGLQRYDGYHFNTYINTNHDSLYLDPNIIANMLLYGNYIILCTEAGIQIFNLKTNSFFKQPVTVAPYNNAKHVAVDSTGHFWFTNGPNLLRGELDTLNQKFDFELKKSITVLPDSLKIWAYVTKLHIDKRNKIWISTVNGVIVYDISKQGELTEDTTFFSVWKNSPVYGANCRDIEVTDSIIYVLGWNSLHLFRYTLMNTSIHPTYSKSLYFDHSFHWQNERAKYSLKNDIFVDQHQSVWVSSNRGLYRLWDLLSNFPKGKYIPAITNNNRYLNTENINNVFVDERKNLWVSTLTNGMCYANILPKNIVEITNEYHPSTSAFTQNNISHIDTDEDGNIWTASTNDDILVYDSNHVALRHLRIGTKYSHNNIQCLKCYGDKAFVCTKSHIGIIDRGSYKYTILVRNADISNEFIEITSLVKDKYQNLWVGTMDLGILRIKPPYTKESITRFNSNNASPVKLLSDNIQNLFYNPEYNELWVINRVGLECLKIKPDGSVQKLNSTHFANNNNLLQNKIKGLAPFNDSTYLVYSYYGYIYYLKINRDNNTIRYMPVQFISEPPMYIETLNIDESGNIWMGNNNIIRFSLNDLLQVTDYRVIKRFKANVAIKHNHSQFIYGGMTGTVIIDSRLQNYDTLPPGIKITHLGIVQNIEHPNTTSIEIDKKGYAVFNSPLNDIHLGFSSLFYSDMEGCRYKYRLWGLDDKWHFISGTNPYARYYDLPYGKYTFEVVSFSPTGIQSKDIAKALIFIKPPFWRNKAAYIAYFIIGTILISLFVIYLHKWITLKNKMSIIEQVHQSKLRFFTNISHEFRTPLTLILSPLQKIMEAGYDSQTSAKYFPVIHRNALSLLKLVNELLEFRKVETGNLRLNISHVSPHELLQSIVEDFNDKATDKNIELSVHLDNTVKWVMLDKEIVSKVLYNLIANAIAYTPEGGCIACTVRQNSSAIPPEYAHKYQVLGNKRPLTDYVEFTIKDTGIGISSGSIGNIFDRFYQVEPTNSPKHIGSGIGLALVRNLVVLHKGDIIVHSAPDVGSIFSVHFSNKNIYNGSITQTPKVIPQAIQPSTSRIENKLPGKVWEKKHTILIVDDNDDIIGLVEDGFKEEFFIKKARNGQEALNLIEKQIPDLVLSDIMMPLTNGYELCERIKSSVRFCHVPVVLFTAKSSEESLISGFGSGADWHISKPFNMEILKAQVKSIIRNRQRYREKLIRETLADLKIKTETNHDEEFINQIMTLIRENIRNNNLNVNYLCKAVGLSRTSLLNKLKSITSYSPNDFIRIIRLKSAAQLLKTTQNSAAEIGYECGFSSPSYFSKRFKEEYNCSPSEYAKDSLHT